MLGFLNSWRQSGRTGGESPPIPNASCPIVHLIGPGHVRLANERLAFDAGWEGQEPTRQVVFDVDHLEHLCCYGRVQISVDAMHRLLEREVNVALISIGGGEFLGRLTSEHGQKPLDRVIQSTVLSNPTHRLLFARTFVSAKIRSAIGAARHFQRHGYAIASDYLVRLKPLVNQAEQASTMDSLRGCEGLAAAAWFDLFARMIRKPFSFPRRSRRPPTDPVNALLSLGYTLLTQRTSARLTALGFEVALGCLHEFRSGRPSLACDHVEPLRVHAVDRWVLGLLNDRILRLDDFETPNPALGVRLNKKVFPRVLASWEAHWRESRSSDILDQQISDFRNQLRDLRPKLPALMRQLELGEGCADA